LAIEISGDPIAQKGIKIQNKYQSEGILAIVIVSAIKEIYQYRSNVTAR
jgi:hypothetical protein